MDIEKAIKILKKVKGRKIKIYQAKLSDSDVILYYDDNTLPVKVAYDGSIVEGWQIHENLIGGNCEYQRKFSSARFYLGNYADACGGKRNVEGGTATYCITNSSTFEEHISLCEKHATMLLKSNAMKKYNDSATTIEIVSD